MVACKVRNPIMAMSTRAVRAVGGLTNFPWLEVIFIFLYF